MFTVPFLDLAESWQQEILRNCTVMSPFLVLRSSLMSILAFTAIFVWPFVEIAVISWNVALDLTFPFSVVRRRAFTLTPSEIIIFPFLLCDRHVV